MIYLGRINPFRGLQDVCKNLIKNKFFHKYSHLGQGKIFTTLPHERKKNARKWVRVLKTACFERNESWEDFDWDYRDYYRF